MENMLPNTWEDLKKEIIMYCTEAIRKYKDENWSNYLKRLWDFCTIHNFKEQDVIKKFEKNMHHNQCKCYFTP
jgi:hypothetical protein